MTTKMYNTMELNLNELEIVTGGTVGELEDLVHAFVCTGSDYGVLFAAHCPGANYGTAKIVEELLNSALGISADTRRGYRQDLRIRHSSYYPHTFTEKRTVIRPPFFPTLVKE